MNKVMVKIQGSEYPMVGDKSEQHMIKVADFVDKEMTKVIQSNSKLSTSIAAIVTAINITDLLFECSHLNDELAEENEDLKSKIGTPDEELKLEIKKLKLDLQNKVREEAENRVKLEGLNKIIEAQKEEISKLSDVKQGSKEEIENYKLQIKELTEQFEEANERATISQSLSTEFQNKAYKIQLKYTELENEVQLLRAKG